MATRRGFLKALAIICAAPSVVKEIAVKDVKPTLKTKLKKAVYFKLTPELLADTEGLDYYINHYAKEAGIDIDKEFNYQIGYDNDDFTKNLLTCVISQYTEAA